MKYFGTDGIRGDVSEVFKLDSLTNMSAAISSVALKYNISEVCIGQDPRISSNYISSILIGTLLNHGIDVINLEEVSAPVVSYTIINNENVGIGIMVSASHNPYTDNGIKIFGHDGKKITEKIEFEIEEEINKKNINNEIVKIGKLIKGQSYLDEYKRYVEKLGTDFSKFKIALDLSNGSACKIAPEIFRNLGAHVEEISNEPDGYNINKNVGSTHIEALVEFVKGKDIDFGFAYDGDADRVILVNREGMVLDGDYIIYIIAKYYQEINTLNDDKVVITSMANLGLKKSLDKININYEESDVGDKYVMRMLDKYNLNLGGEQSGHIILRDFLPTGDGILVSVILTEIILKTKMDLVNITQEFIKYPQKLINVKVKDKQKIISNEWLLKEIDKEKKEILNEGRILVRASGTENLIRIMVEHENYKVCESACNKILQMIKLLEKTK